MNPDEFLDFLYSNSMNFDENLLDDLIKDYLDICLGYHQHHVKLDEMRAIFKAIYSAVQLRGLFMKLVQSSGERRTYEPQAANIH